MGGRSTKSVHTWIDGRSGRQGNREACKSTRLDAAVEGQNLCAQEASQSTHLDAAVEGQNVCAQEASQSTRVDAVVQGQNEIVQRAPSTLVEVDTVIGGPQIPWIELHQLVFKRRLGEGGYGIVDEYQWMGRRVAVKTLVWEGRETLDHEAALLGKVQQHPNVVGLIGCAFNEAQNKGMLVMELMSQDLRSLIDERRRGERRGAAPFSLPVAVDMMRQIANGLLHLRQLRVLHRDLKSLNILVNPRSSSAQSGRKGDRELSYDVKLSDFGRSKCNEQDSLFSSVVAQPCWRAPEVFRDADMISNKYTWSSDVYSFAMVCYEILSGDFPFQELPPGDLHEAICDGERPELPANCPDDLLELIHECWVSNPDKRPAISEIHQRLSKMIV